MTKSMEYIGAKDFKFLNTKRKTKPSSGFASMFIVDAGKVLIMNATTAISKSELSKDRLICCNDMAVGKTNSSAQIHFQWIQYM